MREKAEVLVGEGGGGGGGIVSTCNLPHRNLADRTQREKCADGDHEAVPFPEGHPLDAPMELCEHCRSVYVPK
jgi:hypothetical protein